VLLALALALLGPTGSGQDTASPDAKAFEEQVRPFLSKHCQECHGAEKPKGNFRLAQLSDKNSGSSWHSVLEQLQSGDMPPKKKPRPPESETKVVLEQIRKHVAAADAARRATEGRVRFRRLNRVEYENTLRDLLSVDVNIQDLLPADTSAHGFDNV